MFKNERKCKKKHIIINSPEKSNPLPAFKDLNDDSLFVRMPLFAKDMASSNKNLKLDKVLEEEKDDEDNPPERSILLKYNSNQPRDLCKSISSDSGGRF